MPEEWTPGFGKPYYQEPKFYVSPKVKELDLPDDRTNVANPAHKKWDRFYTNDEITEIWAKPLEGYQVTAEEQKKIDENPQNVNSLFLIGGESPCKAHVQNMLLDRCDDPSVGTSNKTMLQDTACNTHYYRLLKCFAKHIKWYEARREALRNALPEYAKAQSKPLYTFTRYDADPASYYKKV